jgi:hypothetical protein
LDAAGVALQPAEDEFYQWIDRAYVTPDDLIFNDVGASVVRGDGVPSVAGAHSPVHLLLTDPDGNRTGYAPDGTFHQEIPDSIWRRTDGTESGSFEGGQPAGAPDTEGVESVSANGIGIGPGWTITVTGFDTDAYVLVVKVLGDMVGVVGTTSPGEVDVFPVEGLPPLEAPPGDSDGDGCPDARELTDYAPRGGDRNPYDPWDYFDVTDDASIDVADVVRILAHFGEAPTPENAQYDREADPIKRHQTAFAGNGVDIDDAVLNLQSFGHACF